MKAPGQRGILLLPVALALALVGTLAYAMTRDGSMSVSAVDAEHDLAATRYLAEAGLHLAKWQNEVRGCSSEVAFDTVTLPGGEIKASKAERKGNGVLVVSLSARGKGGAIRTLADEETAVHRRSDVRQEVLTGSDDADTTITKSGNASSNAYLSASDDAAYALIRFYPSNALSKAEIVKAQLTLTKLSSNSTQPVRSLGVHRLTSDWTAGSATWVSPGGDHAPLAAATTQIDPEGEFNGAYAWGIETLVQGWASGAFPNYGVLLKPSGLVDARFGSFESANKPQLVVRYYPRC